MSRISPSMLSFLVLLMAAAPGACASSAVLVVAHNSVPADTVSRNELRDIYLGDIRQWQDGTSIVVVDTKPRTKTKDAFYDYIGKSPSRMKSIWIKKLLSGEGNPPEVVNSDDEAVVKVSTTHGAIGFVSKGTPTDSVKVLAEIVVDDD